MRIEHIEDGDGLFRRIVSDWIKQNGKVSTAAFTNTTGTDDMSVDLERLSSPHKAALNNPKYGAAKFRAGEARNQKQTVFHEPENDNDAHSTVQGRKTDAIRKAFSRFTSIDLFPGWSTEEPGNN